MPIGDWRGREKRSEVIDRRCCCCCCRFTAIGTREKKMSTEKAKGVNVNRAGEGICQGQRDIRVRTLFAAHTQFVIDVLLIIMFIL